MCVAEFSAGLTVLILSAYFNQNVDLLIEIVNQVLLLCEQFDAITLSNYVTSSLPIFILCTFTTVIPLTLPACLAIELAPTHTLLLEWFEIEVTLDTCYIPLFIVLAWLICTVSSAIFKIAFPAVMLHSLTYNHPVALYPKTALRETSRKLRTSGFGTMSERSFCAKMRRMQVLSRAVKSLYESVFFSFHFVSCMIVFVSAAFAFIRRPGILFKECILIATMAVCAVSAPVGVIFEESWLLSCVEA